MTRASLVDRSVGSVHTGFGLCALAAGGSLDTHVHSFENSSTSSKGRPSWSWTAMRSALGIEPIC